MAWRAGYSLQGHSRPLTLSADAQRAEVERAIAAVRFRLRAHNPVCFT